MTLETTTGTRWDTAQKARCSLILFIDDRGQPQLCDLKIIGLGKTHTEWGELKTDIKVMDQFGECYEICEDLLYQLN